jgi:hypothetical protein
MISHRKLTDNDLERAIQIIESRPDVFMGMRDDQFKNNIINVLPTFINDPLYLNIGMFTDGQLNGFGIMKEMVTQPAWVWGYWLVEKNPKINFLTNEYFKAVVAMENDLFAEMEETRKLNRFYFSYPADKNNPNPQLKNSSFNTGDRMLNFYKRNQEKASAIGAQLKGARYKFFVDCLVPANTSAKYPYQNAILADRHWPIDVAVNMGMLQSIASGS